MGRKIRTVPTTYRLSENFLNCPETFQTARKLSRMAEELSWSSRNLHPVQKLSRESSKFLDYDNRILLMLSGNFPYCLEIFQTVKKVSRLKFAEFRTNTFRVFGPLDNAVTHQDGWFCRNAITFINAYILQKSSSSTKNTQNTLSSPKYLLKDTYKYQ